MIRIRMNGRLGNQLFIYAFAKACMKKYKTDVVIYDRKKETDAMWHSHLDRYILDPAIRFSSMKEVLHLSLKQKILFYYEKIRLRHKSPRDVNNFQLETLDYYARNGLIVVNDGYFTLPDHISSDVYCEGYFQSARYFDAFRDELMHDLTPRAELTEREKEFLRKIRNTNSVCLTVRLGDYLGNKVHQVCNKQYYQKAMDAMKQKYPDCVFYAFSDDVKMLREVFGDQKSVVYDEGTSQDVISLYIMSQCKHFIISNSSFSWWAQYMADYAYKTVIAPSRWYAVDIPCDIMQPHWHLMD